MAVGSGLGRRVDGNVAHEREAQLPAPGRFFVIEAEEPAEADADPSLFRGLAHRRRDEVLPRLHPTGRKVKGAVALFDDEVPVVVRKRGGGVRHDDQDDQRGGNHPPKVAPPMMHATQRLPQHGASGAPWGMVTSAYPGDLFEHLRSLLVLLRQVAGGGRGAFEQAARELAVDRSVLRRRMQTLAAWVGGPLLSGRGQSLRPTAAGARLADRAAALLAAASRLPAEVAGVPERLVVACTGTITTEVLPKVLVDLERSEIAPQIAVRRAGGAACERLLRGRDVDLGVVRGEAPPPGLASVRLSDDRVWALLPRTHPLAKERARITLERLAALPLVLYGASSRTRARIMDRLGPLGASIRVEVDGKASALAYVRAGLGASFASLLPGHGVTHPGVVARDVTSLFAASSFYLVALRERWNEPALQRVVERIVHYARTRPEP